MRAKALFLNVRVIILVIVLILAIVAINPRPWAEGVAIRSIVANTAAAESGIAQPSPKITPIARERITEMNNQPIKNVADYYAFIGSLGINQTVQIKTNKGLYRTRTREAFDIIELNETEQKNVSEIARVNETADGTAQELVKTINKTITVPKTKKTSKGLEDLGFRVSNAPKTNIRKGLDLQGGTRVLLQPADKLPVEDMETLIGMMSQRLNVYGLSDLVIRDASDLSRNQYILVEIAGATEDEIQKLVASQGKFEAAIVNQTVFVGGKDIKFVCRSADCSGIDPQYGCQISNGEHVCRFRFSIAITPEAARRQADITSIIPLSVEDTRYLSAPLELYLDDRKVDQLSIGADLQGSPTTEIMISGNGIGASQQEAVLNAIANMKNLQTVLYTGALPVKLNIVKIDAVSPLLGESFLINAMIAGAIALLAVVVFVFIFYRKLVVALPMVVISCAEIAIMFGVAALIGWNIDLAAVAGIIVAFGTGVNDQIIIADESVRGQRAQMGWKERFKNAFFIIFGAYATIFVAMIPLLFAGAGLLKGFAITTLIGATVGVLVTRPAYAKIVEVLSRE